MKQSEQIGELAKALAKAQSEMKGALKDSPNPYFKSNYANLESVISAMKPLATHGLAFTQDVFTDEKGVTFVTAQIMHESGQWKSFGPLVCPAKDLSNPQAIKSAITLMRRAQLLAVAGLAEADDDGNDATAVKATEQRQAPPPPQAQKAPLQNFAQKAKPSEPLATMKAANPYPVVPTSPLEKHMMKTGGKL